MWTFALKGPAFIFGGASVNEIACWHHIGDDQKVSKPYDFLWQAFAILLVVCGTSTFNLVVSVDLFSVPTEHHATDSQNLVT